MRLGEFWFAAGINFTSFALVDGIAVVSVKIGDGLRSRSGAGARWRCARPEFARSVLNSCCCFSTSEGVLWIQAQPPTTPGC